MYLNLYRTIKEPDWLDKLVQHIDRILIVRSDVPPYEVYDPRYVDEYGGWGQNRYSQYRPEYTDRGGRQADEGSTAARDHLCAISMWRYLRGSTSASCAEAEPAPFALC